MAFFVKFCFFPFTVTVLMSLIDHSVDAQYEPHYPVYYARVMPYAHEKRDSEMVEPYVYERRDADYNDELNAACNGSTCSDPVPNVFIGKTPEERNIERYERFTRNRQKELLNAFSQWVRIYQL